MICGLSVADDTGVTILSKCLHKKNVILAITGGIAATESIKLARELRRHGANVTPMMTRSAEKVISPLALSWGSGSEVLTDWDSQMAQLGRFDGILVAPATRNTISKFTHGILDSPVMMALSAANGNGVPIMFVPSMHDDLFNDPVTLELVESLKERGLGVFYEDSIEGRKKQPNHVSIVANFSNQINSKLPGRKRIAVTLGSNKSPIDSIRFISNTSTGRTGWSISEHLFRMGHEIVCIVGSTTVSSKFPLPEVIVDESPEGMLDSCIGVARSSEPPDCWIHSAAVLDYVAKYTEGKKSSGDGEWSISLYPTKKHIEEISKYMEGKIRIGFKLEIDKNEPSLVESAMNQISTHGMDLVVANNLTESMREEGSRCRLVYPNGSVQGIPNLQSLCEAIDQFISLSE